jgi:opacity protein-like surface antigen
MRQILFFMLLLGLISTPSTLFAQGSVEKGIKIGLSLSEFTYDSPSADLGDKIKTGLCFGGYVSFKLTPNLALQPEVLYAQRGGNDEEEGRDEQGDPTGTFETRYSFDYLEIPVLARVSIRTGGTITPCILAGPAIAFKLSSKVKWPPDPVLHDDTGSEEEVDWIKSNDFRFVLGAGADIAVGNVTVSVEARYGIGLSNIYEGGGQTTMKHRIISILAGLGF